MILEVLMPSYNIRNSYIWRPSNICNVKSYYSYISPWVGLYRMYKEFDTDSLIILLFCRDIFKQFRFSIFYI